MRALLGQTLHGAGLSFLAWTALVLTSVAPLTPKPVAQRQSASHLTASAVDTQHVINQLVDARLVATDRDGLLFHPDQGAELFKGLSGAIEEITCALYGDSPAATLRLRIGRCWRSRSGANQLLASNP